MASESIEAKLDRIAALLTAAVKLLASLEEIARDEARRTRATRGGVRLASVGDDREFIFSAPSTKASGANP